MDRSSGASPGSAGSPSLDPLAGFEPNHGRPLDGPLQMSDNPLPWNILKFYQDSETSPWTPLGLGGTPPVRQEDHRGHGRSAMVSYQPGVSGYAWQDYRSAPQSDSGTVPPCNLPSDSGYSSQHPRPSMDAVSICTGGLSRDQDIQSVTGHVGRMNVYGQEALNHDAMRMGTGAAPAAAAFWRDGSAKQTPNLWCDHCQKNVKTRSELKKHEQRHVKPFLCDEPNCTRKQQGKPQGFSTRNDLDRHKKTVHNDKSAAGVRYRCNLDQCKTKIKLWPRADNFRSHLKRIHHRTYSAEDSLEEFIDRQPTQCGQEDVEGAEPFSDFQDGGGLDVWPTMDMDAPQNRIAPEASQEDRQRSELHLESPKIPQFTANFPDPRSGHQGMPHASQRTLEQLLPLSLDPSPRAPAPAPAPAPGPAPAPAHRTMKGAAMSPPPSSQDVGNPFLQRRSITGSVQDSAVSNPFSSFGANRIGQHPENVVGAGANNGSSHRRGDGKAPSADVPANGKPARPSDGNTAEVDVQNIGDCHKPEIERPGSGVADGGAASTPSSPSTAIKEAGEGEDEDDAVQGQSEEEIIKMLERLPQELIAKYWKKTATAKKPPAVSTHANNNGGNRHGGRNNTKYLHSCPDPKCDRKFPRKCELKKHMKRHDKPYGCTFPPCPKRFGSKSDWKRHENSQHFQLEIWECNEKKFECPNEPCVKICYRRETFKHHLQKDHHIEDHKKLEEKQEKCRVGRHCDAKFWCGFCERSIEVSQSRLNAWTERFNHIDDHFSGRNNVPKKEISEWKSVDPDLPEVDLSPPAEGSCSALQNNQSSATSATDKEDKSSESGQAHSKRRRAETDASAPAQNRVPKRQRNEEDTLIWTCCQCSSMAVLKTTPVCLDEIGRGMDGARCTHVKCSDCRVSSHTPNEMKLRAAKNHHAPPPLSA